MGEDVDFYDVTGVADPHLVGKLSGSDTPPRDPIALAQLLDERCGHQLKFGVTFAKGEYAALRRNSHKRLLKIKKLATELLAEDSDENRIFRFTTCLGDLIAAHASAEERSRRIRDISQAVAILADTPLIADFAKFQKRPILPSLQKAVADTVAEYWASVEGSPFVGGVDRSRGFAVIIKRGTPAGLLHSVFLALEIDVTPSQIETLMGQV